MAEREKLIELKDLQITFGSGKKKFVAVDHVNFDIYKGETFSLVGESGSGKTTIGRAICRINPTSGGDIYFKGQKINGKIPKELDREVIRKVQMIFQDSMSSLNPRKRIEDIIAEPIRNFENLTTDQERDRVQELLSIVGMPSDAIYKFPHEFSGGQRQRIGIARAVATNPKLIVADEPTSALDLSVQAQVLNFMKHIQQQYNIAFLFISHDLGVVKHMSENLAIMHRGRLVEVGSQEEIYKNPEHIYTKRLLSAIPKIDVEHRAEHAARRREIEREFLQDQANWYDSDGRVYPLTEVGPNHQVALPKEQIKGGE